jgi:hypothetical protein
VVPTEDLRPERTPSKKIRPAGARAVVPGIHFPDDPEIHLEKQKKIWVKGRHSGSAARGSGKAKPARGDIPRSLA